MNSLNTVVNSAKAVVMAGSANGPNREFKPLHNICEYLNAIHIYTEEARHGKTRAVDAHHFCSQIDGNLRQCLIYDSGRQGARLIGVEYMVPKHIYETLDPEEQKLWHSHEYEVLSGMLVLGAKRPDNVTQDEWDAVEMQAVNEVIGLYGKTWHFWQVDRGDVLPLGCPVLMGSLTCDGQADLQQELAGRNEDLDVDHLGKACTRKESGIKGPGVHENADSWWTEAGCYGPARA